MKKFKSIIFSLAIALIYLPQISFAAWDKLPGAATDIGSGGNTTWVTGTNSVNGGYGVWRWNMNNWQQIDGGAIAIAADSAGRPWVANNQGEIFTYNGSWHKLPGLAHDISVGGPDSVWVVGFDRAPGGFKIYHWNGSDWDEIPGGAVHIAVGTDGNPWVVNNKGEIYHYSNGNWQSYPGHAKDIAVGRNGSVWIIGTNPAPGGYGIYRWTGNSWSAIDGAGIRIAVDDNGMPWVVNRDRNIFRYYPDRPSNRHHRFTLGHDVSIDFRM